MKKKKKNYVLTAEKPVNGRVATILVYGELWEDGFVDGLRIQRVGLSRDGRRVIEHGTEILGSLGIPYARTKYFNFGWAICAPGDKFSEEEGIKIAKKRFSISPLSTQSGNLLTDDMNLSILQNELDFISNNFEKFYRRTEPKESKEPSIKPNDIISIEQADDRDYESYIHLACVEELKENNDVVLKWDIEAKKEKNGALLRRFNSGQHTVLKHGDPISFHVATDEEIESLDEFLSGNTGIFS